MNHFVFLLIFFILLYPIQVFSTLSDSIQIQLKQIQSDTAKINYLSYLLSQSTLKQDPTLLETLLPLYDSVLNSIDEEKVPESFFLFAKSRYYYSLARYYRLNREFFKAFQACNKVDSLLALLPQDDPKVIKARIANQSVLTQIYHSTGLLEKAIEITTKMIQTLQLKVEKTKEDTAQLMILLFNLGALYDEAKQHQNALHKFNEVEKILQSFSLPRLAFNLYLQFAQFYLNDSLYVKAQFYLKKAYETALQMQSEYNLNRVYSEFCKLYYLIGKIDSAHFFCRKVTQLKDEDETDYFITLLKIYIAEQQYQKALKLIPLLDSLTQSKEFLQIEYYETLLSFYEKTKKYDKALEIAKKLRALQKSISNQDLVKAITQSEMKIAFTEQLAEERIAREKAIFLREEKLKRQRYLLIGISFILLLVVTGGVLLYNRYKVIQEQKSIIEEKNKIIEKKNKDILDSVAYARRLQQAILPPDTKLKELLPTSWVFFQPKDIVSGDFYWISKKGNRIYFAVADCTGHGIPGAILSMIGYNGLNAALEHLPNPTPSEILYFVHEFFIHTLQQHVASKMMDGMDISLGCYLPHESRLLISGAKHTAYLVRQKQQILTYRLSRTSIGFSILEKPVQFKDHEIFIQPGDQLFFSSDGIKDQFGGAMRKKFGEKRFQNLLLNLTQLPFAEQLHYLIISFNEWKNGNEQIDDVCVFSILYT